MPYAPLEGLVAFHRQPLSPFHRLTRQLNWEVVFQPYAPIIDLAIACAEPGVTTMTVVGAGLGAGFGAGGGAGLGAGLGATGFGATGLGVTGFTGCVTGVTGGFTTGVAAGRDVGFVTGRGVVVA